MTPALLREFVPADIAAYDEMDADPNGTWRTNDPHLPIQAEALRWIALGRSGCEAARLMAVSPRTAEKHLQAAYAKLGVAGSSEAAATV